MLHRMRRIAVAFNITFIVTRPLLKYTNIHCWQIITKLCYIERYRGTKNITNVYNKRQKLSLLYLKAATLRRKKTERNEFESLEFLHSNDVDWSPEKRCIRHEEDSVPKSGDLTLFDRIHEMESCPHFLKIPPPSWIMLLSRRFVKLYPTKRCNEFSVDASSSKRSQRITFRPKVSSFESISSCLHPSENC